MARSSAHHALLLVLFAAACDAYITVNQNARRQRGTRIVPTRFANSEPTPRHTILSLGGGSDNGADNEGADAVAVSTSPGRSRHRRRLLIGSTTVVATALSQSLLPAAAATATAAVDYVAPTPPFPRDLAWPLGKVAFSLLPLAGTATRRATIETCVVPDTIWTHDQIQGIVNVNVPVRQVVVRLADGSGLWVLNPVAPTPQLRRMMRRLVERYGPVRHIVLGTVALEHKATFGPFAAQFPDATCWVQPGQWSFPLPLPLAFLGVRQWGRRLREIPQLNEPGAEPPAWTSDVDYEVLGPFAFQSVGGFSETAFYHRATRTLLVTDTVCSVTATPPAIVQEDPRALLYHARDSALAEVRDTPAARAKGWRRMVQFGLVFFPSQIQVRSAPEALREARAVPADLRNLGAGAVPGGTLYPWTWPAGDADQRNFDAISRNGALFCPPILTKLILDREPAATLAWADRVAARFRDTRRVIPAHLDNDVAVRGGADFARAFDPLRSRPDRPVPQRALAEDLALLQAASDLLTRYGVVAPSRVCDGEPARREGRFAALASARR